MTKSEALQKIKELEDYINKQDTVISEENYKSLEMVNFTKCEKPFKIAKYLVTQELWQAVMGNNPSSFRGENLPVETVSWDYIQIFIKKLNEITGIQYRLPTEYE